jgi:hypothetical protein
MAGSSSDEDENYWPGYVDALTTMTMVLTFIMMVLGVMVFVLSQDAVSSKLGMLARALKIEARTLDKLNQVEIEEALRRAVARKDFGDGVAPQQAGEQVGIDGEGVVDRTRSNTAWGGSGGQGGPGGGQRGAPATANREATPTDQTRSANGIIGNPGLGPVGLTREAARFDDDLICPEGRSQGDDPHDTPCLPKRSASRARLPSVPTASHRQGEGFRSDTKRIGHD